jgi:translation initiation factor 3 subunit B
MLSAYQAEQGNLPARVAIVRLPDREELRQKNLFSVAGACVQLFWIWSLPCARTHGRV